MELKSIQRQVPEGYKYIHGGIESIQNTPVKQQLQLEFTVAFTKENISRNRLS